MIDIAKILVAAAAAAAAATATAQFPRRTPGPPAEAGAGGAVREVTVDASKPAGRIRSLLGVNRGPFSWPREPDRPLVSHVGSFRTLGVDIIRTHDFYGPTDWHVLFPRWDADPADEAAYDFRASDERIAAIVTNGFACFYRLGTSWKGRRLEPINDPPGTRRDSDGRVTHAADREDFKKWAAVAAQTVRHYTAGWNRGFRFPIAYWEIWNEPDLAASAFRAWKRLLETPERVEARGGDEQGWAAVAGRDAEGRRVQILLSDFQSGDRAFRLRVRGLPWDAAAPVAMRRWLIDGEHRMDLVEDIRMESASARAVDAARVEPRPPATPADPDVEGRVPPRPPAEPKVVPHEVVLERPFRAGSVCLVELQPAAGGLPAALPPAGDARLVPVPVRIPSEAAGDEGVAATVFLPPRPRFPAGAPVVIHVNGGVQAGTARGRPEYAGHGFIEIRFAFPGGGEGDERSGGTYDFRGPACIRALADVVRFATGRLAARDGKRIGDLAGGFAVLTNNCGLVGSSHGGNAAGLAMALHGREFPDLAWYASMESPYGEGAANVELGGRESGLNPAYNPATGTLDLSRLAWDNDQSPGLFRKAMPVPTRELHGALYFDLNGDGRFEPGDDFPANCFVGDAGGGAKAWYSPRLLAEAARRKLIPAERPAHVPTPKEAEAFWRYRDAAPSIPAAVRACTGLAVIVYANARDHVQADPAHTHILVQVEGFRKAGARFVRLNPDRAYVERIAGALPGRPGSGLTFPDNPAGKTWDRKSMGDGVEPADLPLGLYMQAAVCELADRAQARDFSPDLAAVLVPDAPLPGPDDVPLRPPLRRPPRLRPRP